MTRFLLLGLVAALACGDDDSMMADAGGGDDARVGEDAGACMPRPVAERPDPGMCEAFATDYAVCEDDAWAPCISDFGTYARIEPEISTIARVGAFEQIAPLLFDAERDPSADEFLMARDLYQEEEGLDSRVARRYDPRADAPEGTDCTLDGVPAMFPDYCVGPAILQPLILDAFAAGMGGETPRVQAARIEAGLLWFLYASVAKESLTCTTKAKDCDSAYAYYTGGETERGGIGLAGRVMAADPYAHDRAWDGILGLRCWRDLDPGETATDLALREQARDQIDRATTDGVAAVVSARLDELGTGSAEADAAHWAFVQVLGRALFRPLGDRDAAAATEFETALGEETPPADASTLRTLLANVFDCP